jgi:EpsI family protein
MLAQFSGSQAAVGVDHLIYGGLFFAAIMLILFTFGALWREDSSSLTLVGGSVPAGQQGPVTGAAAPAASPNLGAALAVTVGLLVWPLLAIDMGRDSAAATVPIGAILPRAGWVAVDDPITSWRPQLAGPSQEIVQTFAKNGSRVGVYVGSFDHPSAGAKLTSATNQLVTSQDKQWRQIDRGVAELRHGNDAVSVKTGTLAGQGMRIVAWQWYWVDGTLTSSRVRAALLQVLARIRGRSQMSAWVTVYTADNVEATASAPRVLETFLFDMLDAINERLRMTGARESR